MYDVIIIGAGFAGFSAAIYAVRSNLKTLVVSKMMGGAIVDSVKVENYPGYKEISGLDLMKKFEEQAKSLGSEIISDEVIDVSKADDGFKLNAAHGLSIWYPPTWNKYDTSDENSLVFGSLMFYPDPAIGLDWLDDSTWLNYLFEYFDRADANLEGYGPDGDEPPKKGVDRDF